jgi:transposase InsO family protein
LTGADNYAVWKIKMMDILTGQDLWEYVDGTTTEPSDGTAKAAWKKKDRMALSTIRLRVADKMLVYVASSATSKEAWDGLKSLLETQGALGIVLARRKLFRSQCADETPIEEHLRTLRGYQEELHSLGQKIDGEEFSIILLTSLPESWDNYIASIDTTALKDSSKLIARILEHDRRLSIKSSDDTALAGKHGKKKYNPNITCFRCGEKGHIGRQCKKKPKDGKGSKGGKQKESTEAHAAADEEFAFCGDCGDDIALVVSPDSWLADSACTSHIARDRSIFVDYTPTPGHQISGFGKAPGLGRGTIRLESTVEGKTSTITLKNVVHAPDAPFNLISISRAIEAGAAVLFSSPGVKIRSPTGTIIMEGRAANRLFEMNVKGVGKHDQACPAKHGRTWDEWHRIFGHLNMASVRMLKDKGMVSGMEVDRTVEPAAQCKACIAAKQHVQPFPKNSETEIKEIGDLTVSDVWGPARTQAPGGDRYFITFTDGKARRTMTYFMKNKSDAFTKFKQYKSFVETQTGRKLKKLRVDGGGEFLSKEFKKYLLDSGIQLEITAPHSPSQNGIAERLNRTLVEHARAMIHQNGLPYSLWKEAVAYATYLKNRSPTRAIKEFKVPDEVFWGKKPDVSHLQEFGKICWVLQQGGNLSKLDPKSREFIFVGIADGTKGYRYYNTKTHQILTSRNVVFLAGEEKYDEVEVTHPTQLEGESGNDGKQSSGGESNQAQALAPETEPEITSTPHASETPSRIPVRRERSARILSQPLINYRLLNNPNSRGPTEWKHHVPTTEELGHITVDYAMIGASLEDDPLSLKEAKERSDWPKWKVAMDVEVDQLAKRGTYKLVKLPPDRQAIACKWVYRIKRDHIGEITKHKARLVAKGCSQIPGVDFVETFAPVMRLETLRLLLALATELGLVIHVVDVVGAYLNGTLEEIIFMMQPPEYDDGSGRVCQLLKPLYGLKQAGRAWNDELNQTFHKMNFTRLFSDQCVYIRHTDHDLLITSVHIDDMTIFGSDQNAVAEMKVELKGHFTITDLGEAKQIVGLELERDVEAATLKIMQSQYIKRVLQKFGMTDSHPVSTPLDPNVKLVKTPETEHYDIPDYRSAIGSLMYAAVGTRPDISFAVQTLSQFMSNPGPAHWTAVKRVFRYLNGTRDFGIIYRKGGEVEPFAYSDADWGANVNDRKSISGYIFQMAGAPISWQSKKQPTVALSSMEAEYMAESLATRQIIWLRTLTAELGIPYFGPTILNVDNQGAIDYSYNAINHGRTKHIDIQHHFVREKLISNEIRIQYCATDDNLADLLTKALPKPKHEDLVKRLGMA